MRPFILALIALAVLPAGARGETLTGHIQSERPDWVYIPFDVPAGTNRIDVAYSYNKVDGNALDIGLFGPDGFRGWSGGARTAFTVATADATPGYDTGRIRPGRWRVILGPYTVGPAGIDYSIEITLHSGPQGKPAKPHLAPGEVPGRKAGWYRGDLHIHTVFSDGGFTPQDVVAGARAAGLDFFVSTEHNTDAAQPVWGAVVPRSLLALRGEEVTTRAGHWGAIGLKRPAWIDWRYRPEDHRLAGAIRKVHRDGGLAIANHPFAPCKACDWGFGFTPMDAIEAWNGPWTPDDELAITAWDAELRAGRHIPAVGASDAHRAPDRIGLPQTVVRTKRLDRGHVLAAIAAGRSYVAESKAVTLRFTARNGRKRAGIGGTLKARSATVALKLAGARGGIVAFNTDGGTVAGGVVAGAGHAVTAKVSGVRWVWAEVRRPDGSMIAFTNPIRLRR